MRRSWAISAGMVTLLAVACSSSSSSGDDSSGGNASQAGSDAGSSADVATGPIKCTHDVDCPNGQVCDEDDIHDSYCTPACTKASDCPPQLSCPGLTPGAAQCEMEQQNESHSRGVCDQYLGFYGPDSCKTAG